MSLIKFGRGNLAQILAATRDADTLYFAKDKQALYLGDNLITSHVSDASWADKVLTISKVDGSVITLDFNDVASAAGVNSLLATLRTDINKNATAVGEVSTRLNTLAEKVANNAVVAGDKSVVVEAADGSTSVKVGISSVADNMLTLQADGLHVAKEAAYTGADAIKVEDHEISLVLDGQSLVQSATGLKANLKLAKKAEAGEGNASAYQLVDEAGNVYGEAIEIAKDQFLSDVSLNANDDLIFTFETTTGQKTETVNIAKYIDTYTEGNGIDITDKKVSVSIKSGEKYLEVSADGLATKGIDDAIAAAKSGAETTAANALSAAKAEIDASIGEVKASIKNIQDNEKSYVGDNTTIEASTEGLVTTFSVKENVFDAHGAADAVKEAVIGAAGDASTANTVYGAKKYAEEEAAAAEAAAKSAVIGAASDASTANTIYGAKKYADEKAAAAQTAAEAHTDAALTWIEL